MTLLYVNLPEGNSFISFTVVVWALIAGIFIGGMLSLYSKAYLGRVVRRLIKKEAFDKESAVTLKQLGISPSRILAHSLREGAPLRKHVFAANEDECRKNSPGVRR